MHVFMCVYMHVYVPTYVNIWENITGITCEKSLKFKDQDGLKHIFTLLFIEKEFEFFFLIFVFGVPKYVFKMKK